MFHMMISGEVMDTKRLCPIITASRTPDGSISQNFSMTFFLTVGGREALLSSTFINVKWCNLAVMHSYVQFSSHLYPYSSDEIHF